MLKLNGNQSVSHSVPHRPPLVKMYSLVRKKINYVSQLSPTGNPSFICLTLGHECFYILKINDPEKYDFNILVPRLTKLFAQ